MTDFGYSPLSTSSHDLFGGEQLLFKFDNGFGASVIRHAHSYGGHQGLWELALIKWVDDDWELVYNDDLDDVDTDDFIDVIGYLDESKVSYYLDIISNMPATRPSA